VVANFFLRFWWVIGIFPYTWDSPIGDFMKKVELGFFMKMMAEAIRRTLWVLIRVENEFHNNFESYRSILIIPKLMDDVENTLNNLKNSD
jgi:hypothetical protein